MKTAISQVTFAALLVCAMTAHAQQARKLGLLACRLTAGIADLHERGLHPPIESEAGFRRVALPRRAPQPSRRRRCAPASSAIG